MINDINLFTERAMERDEFSIRVAQVGELVVDSVYASREFNVETQAVVGQFDTFWQ